MTSIKELREELREARAKAAKDKERKDLEHELFALKHKKKIAFVNKTKGNLIHMGKNAVAMAKKVKTTPKTKVIRSKKEKKKKAYDPFGGVNFNAFR